MTDLIAKLASTTKVGKANEYAKQKHEGSRGIIDT